MEGVVKSYDRQRGYGFLSREGERDLFFHITQCAPHDWEPFVGDRLSYDETVNKGRPCAMNVRPA
jgi:cold shock CspA family protein